MRPRSPAGASAAEASSATAAAEAVSTAPPARDAGDGEAACAASPAPAPTTPIADAVQTAIVDALARRAGRLDGAARERLLQRLARWRGAAAPPLPGERNDDRPAAAHTASAPAPARGDDGAVAPDTASPRVPAAADAGPRRCGAAAGGDEAGTRRTPSTSPGAAEAAAVAPRAASALAALVDRLGRPVAATPRAAPPPLRAVAALAPALSRLRAEQRLRQAQATVPANAGPLNSSRVVHRTLQLLRDIAPAYLDALTAQVDTLLALERRAGPARREAPAAAAPAPAPRAKPRRGRRAGTGE